MQTADVYAAELGMVIEIGLPVAITYRNGRDGGSCTRFCWTLADAEAFLETTKFLCPAAKITVKKITEEKGRP